MRVPGRMQVVAEEPLTIYDGAHNPSGMQALVDALDVDEFVAVVSILDDKDAAGMLRALLGKTAGAVFTRSLQPARAVARDARLAGRAARRAAVRDRSRSACGRGARAGAGGPGRRRPGHRLDLPGGRPAGRAGAPEGVRAVNDRGPSLFAMVAVVAVVVALVILVFFAIGFGLGRAFL